MASFQFSRSVVSDSLWPHDLQHTRPPYPSPTPRVYSNSCSLSQWCNATISSFVIPFSSCLQSFPASGFFSNESALRIRWPKYCNFSFNISPSDEYSGLIYFRMDWLDLLAVQGTLKSLLQHHSSKASILWHSAFFIVQLSHPYMTIGKTIALTRRTFVGKVMSLLLNMLSRLVITFLPRSKRLNFMAAVLLIGTINYCKKLNSKIKINRIIIALLFLFSCSVMSDSFQPHEPKHNRLPCPSLSPRDCSNSGPLNQWCHPTSSASVVPFFSCLQAFPASGYFPVSRLLHQVANGLEFQLQHQSFQWIFRTDFL